MQLQGISPSATYMESIFERSNFNSLTSSTMVDTSVTRSHHSSSQLKYIKSSRVQHINESSTIGTNTIQLKNSSFNMATETTIYHQISTTISSVNSVTQKTTNTPTLEDTKFSSFAILPTTNITVNSSLSYVPHSSTFGQEYSNSNPVPNLNNSNLFTIVTKVVSITSFKRNLGSSFDPHIAIHSSSNVSEIVIATSKSISSNQKTNSTVLSIRPSTGMRSSNILSTYTSTLEQPMLTIMSSASTTIDGQQKNSSQTIYTTSTISLNISTIDGLDFQTTSPNTQAISSIINDEVLTTGQILISTLKTSSGIQSSGLLKFVPKSTSLNSIDSNSTSAPLTSNSTMYLKSYLTISSKVHSSNSESSRYGKKITSSTVFNESHMVNHTTEHVGDTTSSINFDSSNSVTMISTLNQNLSAPSVMDQTRAGSFYGTRNSSSIIFHTPPNTLHYQEKITFSLTMNKTQTVSTFGLSSIETSHTFLGLKMSSVHKDDTSTVQRMTSTNIQKSPTITSNETARITTPFPISYANEINATENTPTMSISIKSTFINLTRADSPTSAYPLLTRTPTPVNVTFVSILPVLTHEVSTTSRINSSIFIQPSSTQKVNKSEAYAMKTQVLTNASESLFHSYESRFSKILLSRSLSSTFDLTITRSLKVAESSIHIASNHTITASPASEMEMNNSSAPTLINSEISSITLKTIHINQSKPDVNKTVLPSTYPESKDYSIGATKTEDSKQSILPTILVNLTMSTSIFPLHVMNRSTLEINTNQTSIASTILLAARNLSTKAIQQLSSQTSPKESINSSYQTLETGKSFSTVAKAVNSSSITPSFNLTVMPSTYSDNKNHSIIVTKTKASSQKISSSFSTNVTILASTFSVHSINSNTLRINATHLTSIISTTLLTARTISSSNAIQPTRVMSSTPVSSTVRLPIALAKERIVSCNATITNRVYTNQLSNSSSQEYIELAKEVKSTVGVAKILTLQEETTLI